MREMGIDTRITIGERLAADSLGYAQGCLASSRFFSGLSRGDIGPRHMQYVFSQYKLWRDGFHSWFALLIMKSGSCTQPARSRVIVSLASHVVSEMQDDHAGMYMKFLQKDIGLNESSLQQLEESVATRVYRRSFAQRFGLEESNFTDAVIALSGRELLASLRNRSLQRSLTAWYHVPEVQWLDLHESLEVDHFNEIVSPLISSTIDAEETLARFISLIRQEIQLHISYWDELLRESLDA